MLTFIKMYVIIIIRVKYYRFLPFSGKFEIYKGDGCGRQKEKIGRL